MMKGKINKKTRKQDSMNQNMTKINSTINKGYSYYLFSENYF